MTDQMKMSVDAPYVRCMVLPNGRNGIRKFLAQHGQFDYRLIFNLENKSLFLRMYVGIYWFWSICLVTLQIPVLTVLGSFPEIWAVIRHFIFCTIHSIGFTTYCAQMVGVPRNWILLFPRQLLPPKLLNKVTLKSQENQFYSLTSENDAILLY